MKGRLAHGFVLLTAKVGNTKEIYLIWLLLEWIFTGIGFWRGAGAGAGGGLRGWVDRKLRLGAMFNSLQNGGEAVDPQLHSACF